jgi:hypothetical protein
MMALLKALALLVAIPFGWWLKAVVCVSLWGWFIVPLGVPAVGLAHVLGISLLCWFFTTGFEQVTRKETPEYGFTQWATVQVVVLMTWGFGAIFHNFM